MLCWDSDDEKSNQIIISGFSIRWAVPRIECIKISRYNFVELISNVKRMAEVDSRSFPISQFLFGNTVSASVRGALRRCVRLL